MKKLFVVQGDLNDIEKERMTDTQYAYGLLIHAANIEEYQMSDQVRFVTNCCKMNMT